MARSYSPLQRIALRELALFLGLLFVGLVLMPVAIFFVGQEVFGAYGGRGYGHFFGALSGKIRHGDFVAWFLVLAPYIAWQIVRLTAFGWRLTGRRQGRDPGTAA